MENSQYILNEINKGIKMGMDSISTIAEKVGDDNFKDDLKFQYDKYNEKSCFYIYDCFLL